VFTHRNSLLLCCCSANFLTSPKELEFRSSFSEGGTTHLLSSGVYVSFGRTNGLSTLDGTIILSLNNTPTIVFQDSLVGKSPKMAWLSSVLSCT
jgi:hypothetical protein